jgi:hypothetical protein
MTVAATSASSASRVLTCQCTVAGYTPSLRRDLAHAEGAQAEFVDVRERGFGDEPLRERAAAGGAAGGLGFGLGGGLFHGCWHCAAGELIV